VVGVALRAAQEYTLSVQLEGAVFDEFNLPDAEALFEMRLSSGAG
jgi:hypothetical protein